MKLQKNIINSRAEKALPLKVSSIKFQSREPEIKQVDLVISKGIILTNKCDF